MKPKKIPRMLKREYDSLINSQFMCRVVFKGDKYPHLAPFLYFFDGKHIYFLSTKYGKKIKSFRENPLVTVEIENYTPDLSDYKFVTLCGKLEEVKDQEERKIARRNFVKLIDENKISKKIMIALGYSPEEPIEAIYGDDRNLVWRLVEVEEIMGLKGESKDQD
jgi:nitroimidazol reductase NimA-like FMN-containing flavoprotein (pyridoxamine 5'-phosphate oxidase superfamily)